MTEVGRGMTQIRKQFIKAVKDKANAGSV